LDKHDNKGPFNQFKIDQPDESIIALEEILSSGQVDNKIIQDLNQ